MPRLLHPNTRRRLRRFKNMRRAKWSLRILLGILLLSLVSEFVANDLPLAVRFEGETYYPAIKDYTGKLSFGLLGRIHPEDKFLNNGIFTRADYKELNREPVFADNEKNWMKWPLIPYGVSESLASTEVEIEKPLTLTIRKQSMAKAASFDLLPGNKIARSRGAPDVLDGVETDRDLRNKDLAEVVPLAAGVESAIADRFADKASPAVSFPAGDGLEISFTVYESRGRAPRSVRLSVRTAADESGAVETAVLNRKLAFIGVPPASWIALTREARDNVLAAAGEVLRTGDAAPLEVESGEDTYTITFDTQKVTFPYEPVKGHRLGLDESGRDVVVQILYATRISLLFGMILVVVTFGLGILFGAVQGYFGSWMDIVGQRLTEIWESLPFLLIMIMMSSIYGRGFVLLLVLYAVFMWIGISYYMRAEFLKLRKQPFVESARVMGLGRWKIMFKHIFPNALTPLIAFFPFSLVGAIFILTSLGYLGLGLPAGAASWGNLLSQGQTYPYAWWLVMFPAIALFIVSILCVFIGEGLRAAFDPRSESKIE